MKKNILFFVAWCACICGIICLYPHSTSAQTTTPTVSAVISFFSPIQTVAHRTNIQMMIFGFGFASTSNTISVGKNILISHVASTDGQTIILTLPYAVASTSCTIAPCSPVTITPNTYTVSISNSLGTSTPTSWVVR
jgi:hypothetical protein